MTQCPNGHYNADSQLRLNYCRECGAPLQPGRSMRSPWATAGVAFGFVVAVILAVSVALHFWNGNEQTSAGSRSTQSAPHGKGPCLNVSGAVVCQEDPPGMHYDAIPGKGCSNASQYIFGRGPDGENLACSGYPPVWNSGPLLFGRKSPGGPCPYNGPGSDVFRMPGEPDVTAAQTSDGRPLICGRDGRWFLN